jgi:hypothetical protein
MPSKREGRIQPSVTSQPPRQTARTGRREELLGGGGVLLPWEREQSHEKHRSRRQTLWKRRLLVPWRLICMAARLFFRSSGWAFYSALLRTHIYGHGDVVMRNGQSVGDECKIREGGCPRQIEGGRRLLRPVGNGIDSAQSTF